MKIVQIGPYPPPSGGIASHVARLHSVLTKLRYDSTVVDVFNRSGSEDEKKANIQAIRYDGPAPTRLIKTVGTIWRLKPDIIHLHLASMRNFRWIGPLLLAILPRSIQLITLHGGNFVNSHRRLKFIPKLFMNLVFARVNHVVTVNETQKDYLVREFGMNPKNVSTISGFLVPEFRPIVNDELLLAEVVQFKEEFDETCLVIGIPHPEYSFETAIKAFDQLRDLSLGLILQIYNISDPEYLHSIRQMAESRPNTLLIESELNSKETMRLILSARIFLRTTTTDGDSVAVKEAAHLNRQIIATDCSRRPKGCVLFPVHDHQTLAKEIMHALDDPSYGLSSDFETDNAEKLVNLYEQIK